MHMQHEENRVRNWRVEEEADLLLWAEGGYVPKRVGGLSLSLPFYMFPSFSRTYFFLLLSPSRKGPADADGRAMLP